MVISLVSLLTVMNTPLGGNNCFVIINMAFKNTKSCQEQGDLQVKKKKKIQNGKPGQEISNASTALSNRLHILNLYKL